MKLPTTKSKLVTLPNGRSYVCRPALITATYPASGGNHRLTVEPVSRQGLDEQWIVESPNSGCALAVIVRCDSRDWVMYRYRDELSNELRCNVQSFESAKDCLFSI